MENFHRKGLLRRKVFGVMALALAVGLMAAPGANAATIDLLTAGPGDFAVLGLGSDVTVTSSTITGLSTVFGNVGVLDTVNPPPHALLTATSSTITGAAFLQNAAQNNISGSTTVNGGVQIDVAKLNQANTDALARSTFYAGLATTNALNTVTNTTVSFTGTNGIVNVLDLTGGLTLTGTNTFTLIGDANTAFVINVPDNAAFSMIGTSKILLSGGVKPENVLFNLLEGNTPYSVLGSEIDGLILAPNVLFTAEGLIFGEIIGHDVTLHSNTTVRSPGVPGVPIPPSAILLGSGLLGLGLFGGRKKWFRKS